MKTCLVEHPIPRIFQQLLQEKLDEGYLYNGHDVFKGKLTAILVKEKEEAQQNTAE